MSEQKNMQVVQNLYSAFGQGDMTGILNCLDESIDWHFNARPRDVPFGGHWRGHEQMMDFFGIVATTCQVVEFGPQEVISFGEHILALGHERVIVRATGREFETDWAHVFTLQDGKIVKLREYYDTAVMAEAFLESKELTAES
jgi:ketosteroid isomerase-like protein